MLFHDYGRENNPICMHNTCPPNGIQSCAGGILTEHSIFDRKPAVGQMSNVKNVIAKHVLPFRSLDGIPICFDFEV